MFDFEKLLAYQRSVAIYKIILKNILTNRRVDWSFKDQLRRAAMSVVFNIAEGAGKYSKLDKRRFYIFSRASINECVAALELLKEEQIVSVELISKLYSDFEELARILAGLMRGLDTREEGKAKRE